MYVARGVLANTPHHLVDTILPLFDLGFGHFVQNPLNVFHFTRRAEPRKPPRSTC